MAIITISNFYRLIGKIDVSKAEVSLKNVFGATRSFFSESDLKKLALAKEILQDPSKLTTFKNCMKKDDTYTFMSEATSPAHHVGKDCDRLWRLFPNWEITENGEKASEEKVKKIRELKNKFPNLINDQQKFEEKIVEVVGEGIKLKPVKFRSRGITTFSANSIEEIVDKIQTLIRESEEHYSAQNPSMQRVIEKYKKATNIAFIKIDFSNNNTGYTQEDLKAYLRDYDNKFKQPLKDLLIEYHMAKHNPNLTFDKELLENFGFVPCRRCSDNVQYLEMFFMKKKVDEIKNEIYSSKVIRKHVE